MKKFCLKLFVAVFICILFSSCSFLKRINSSNTTKPRTEKTSNNSSINTTNNDVYANSMKELKSYGSSLTDYCITWVGTPYRSGGTTKKGVDCSGFVGNVYKDVYNINLPRRSVDMQKAVTILSDKNKMKEGDLVFFGKGKVNHVGIFLRNDRFIHASTSKGVIVSSLEEKYWKDKFHSCGHHPDRK